MIIERYLYRELAQSFVGVLSVLVLIWMSHRFVRYLTEAAAGTLSSDVIVALLTLKLVSNLILVLPLAFYLAVLLGLGRLYQDSEIIAMSASGVSVGRLFQAVFWLSLGFAAVALVLSLYVGPRASALAEQMQTQARESSRVTAVLAGRFKELNEGQRVFYVERISSDRERLENLFIQIRDRHRPLLLAAAQGFQYVDSGTGDRFMVALDGYRYEGEPGDADYTVTRFDKHAVRVQERRASERARETKNIPTVELLGSEHPEWQAELQWRLSMPLSLVIMGSLAVLLARTGPHQGRYARVFNAVLIYFVYTNLLGVAREMVEQERIPAAVGLWPLHGAMIVLTLGLLVYQQYGGWSMLLRRRVHR